METDRKLAWSVINRIHTGMMSEDKNPTMRADVAAEEQKERMA